MGGCSGSGGPRAGGGERRANFFRRFFGGGPKKGRGQNFGGAKKFFFFFCFFFWFLLGETAGAFFFGGGGVPSRALQILVRGGGNWGAPGGGGGRIPIRRFLATPKTGGWAAWKVGRPGGPTPQGKRGEKKKGGMGMVLRDENGPHGGGQGVLGRALVGAGAVTGGRHFFGGGGPGRGRGDGGGPPGRLFGGRGDLGWDFCPGGGGDERFAPGERAQGQVCAFPLDFLRGGRGGGVSGGQVSPAGGGNWLWDFGGAGRKRIRCLFLFFTRLGHFF